MDKEVNDPPSPGQSDGLNGTPLFDDSRLTFDPPSDPSYKKESPGHQGAIAGGSNPNLRVLECIQMQYLFDYETVFDKLSSFGVIQRIKLVMNANEKFYHSYTTFANSIKEKMKQTSVGNLKSVTLPI